jgi:hypothetical protein
MGKRVKFLPAIRYWNFIIFLMQNEGSLEGKLNVGLWTHPDGSFI